MKKKQQLQLIGGVYDSVSKTKPPIKMSFNNKTPKNNNVQTAPSFIKKESI